MKINHNKLISKGGNCFLECRWKEITFRSSVFVHLYLRKYGDLILPITVILNMYLYLKHFVRWGDSNQRCIYTYKGQIFLILEALRYKTSPKVPAETPANRFLLLQYHPPPKPSGPATRCDDIYHFAAILRLLEASQTITGISKSQQCSQSAIHDGMFSYSPSMFIAAMVITNS